MSISQMLMPEFDQEMASTRKILERVPEDKFAYQPHEKSMTLGRLAGHVAEMPSWAVHTMQLEVMEMDAGQKPYVPSSASELLENFDKAVAESRALIAGASDEDFQKIWTFKYAGKAIISMPRVAVLRSMMMNHMIHHRGQLGVYLRLNEVEVPGMYGPSADEMKYWSTQNA